MCVNRERSVCKCVFRRPACLLYVARVSECRCCVRAPTGVCYSIVRLVNHHLNSSEQLGTVCDVRNCCFNKILSRKGKPAKSLRSPQLFGLFSFHGGLWFPLYQLKSTPNGQLSPSLKSRTLLQTSKVPTTAFGCKYTRCASLVCWLVPARVRDCAGRC